MSAEPRTIYRNARLIDPASGLDAVGDLLTVGGKIWEVAPDGLPDTANDGSTVVDCAGHCLAPGFVDMQVYLGEAMDVTARSAARGGITTMVVQPAMSMPLDEVSLVDYIEKLARDADVQVHPMAAATKGFEGREMTEIGLLKAAGAVAFTDGRTTIADARVMRRLLTYASAHDALIVQHVEEPSLAADGVVTEGEVSTRLGLPGIPAEAEVMMLERDLRLVEMTGARYHASIVTTEASVQAMRRAKEKGLPVSCGTGPAWFALNELAIEDYRTFARLSPPLRTEDDRRAVVEGIADGTIDVIVSAHDPHSEEEKRLPFGIAAPGIVGLETLLPLALELVHAGHVTMPRILDALSTRPADLLGLPGGALKKGAPADLVMFNAETPYRIDTETFVSGAKNSPFDDRPVQGRVVRTVVAGATAYLGID